VNVVDRGGVGTLGGSGRGPGPSVTRSSTIEISLRNGRSLKAPADIDRTMLALLIACVEAA
jgi:transposase